MLDPDTADVLRQAIGAARTGDVAVAQALAEAALSRGGDLVALNAFLGMLRTRAGDPAGATAYLREAHRHRPQDATIACNLIAALIETGDNAGALEVASRDLAHADPSLRVARYRGFLAQSLEQFKASVEAYEYVVAAVPTDFESWNNLGNALAGVEDHAGAVTALQRAVELDPQAPPTRLNLAAALQAADRYDEAESVLRRTAADFPTDVRALEALYILLKRIGRYDDALPVIEEAVRRSPENGGLHLKYGVECGLARRTDDAQRAFRRAIALDRTLVDAYLGLAIQYEHTNREEEFAPLIALAVANGLDEGALAFLRALEHRRAKRFEEALACLALVPPEIEPERTVHIRATLLDRVGRTDEAFGAFEQFAQLHQASPTDPLRRGAVLRDELRGELHLLAPGWPATWSTAKPPALCPDPVFLVGFPRSGTTLLDTILMGHPGTAVMEEQPPLNFVDRMIGGISAISTLDEAGIIRAREHYFAEMAKLGELSPGRLLIDKSPLFLCKVPLIQRLFPDARFILAMRHPCDVLLSCFMSSFRLNNAMANFLRLQDAAEFYDLVFRHWEQSCALFPLRIHTVVYERLVENVEAEVRPLFDFLGLEWEERALDHRSTARSRGLITTASYSQVAEPIYQRAAGRWERYRAHLEPILPTLAPWVAKFGYTL